MAWNGELLKATDMRVGDVVQGFGLHNAGVYCTVVKIGRTGKLAHKVLLEGHLTGMKAWKYLTWYRRVS